MTLLTDKEIRDEVRNADFDWHYGWTLDDVEQNRFVTFARAIEAAVLTKLQAQESTQPASKTFEDGFRSGYKSGWEEGYKNGVWVAKQKPLGPEAPVQAQSEPVDAAGNPKPAANILESALVGALNQVKAWADSEAGTPLPTEILMRVDAVLMTAEMRRTDIGKGL